MKFKLVILYLKKKYGGILCSNSLVKYNKIIEYVYQNCIYILSSGGTRKLLRKRPGGPLRHIDGLEYKAILFVT
jgi:hypothetical protein